MTSISVKNSRAPGTNIPSLDGVRAIAVSIVFLAHAGLERIVPGGLGVTVFFVLSGYLITTLMLQEIGRDGSLDFGAFYLRRLLRLMPPLLLVLAATLLASDLGWIDGGYSAAGLLSVLFYWGNYFVIAHDFNGLPAGMGVVWSLAVEEHYYLVYPFVLPVLLRTAGPRGAAGVLLLLCAMVLAWRCALFAAGASESWLTMATDVRIDAILFGGILALLCNPLDHRLVPTGDWRVTWLPLASITLLLASLLLRDAWFRQTIRFTVQSVAVAGLLYCAVASGRQSASLSWVHLLNSPAMIYLGSVSYTIYLCHHVLLFAAAKQLPHAGPVTVALLAGALSLLLAASMRRWVEEPCARLRRRLHQRRTQVMVEPAFQRGT